MDPSFWHERWQSGQTGFHQAVAHPRLAEDWPQLSLALSARVFVPLCGKSLDMRWLAERGHEVVGIELSPIAIREFLAVGNLQPGIERLGSLERLRCGPYTLFIGDFFDLEAEWLGPVSACYDRAALVALPAGMRSRYVERCARLLTPGSSGLLITLEYDQRRMPGPPFSVGETEVRALYEPDFIVDRLRRDHVLADNPKFRERGLVELTEVTYRLRRR